MKDVIIDRCCGNCEWSISPECEEDIMIENHYDEDDPTRPRAGDCCLGVEHDGKCVCEHHKYLSGGLETYTFYEEKDLGPGYYVVNTYYDHILRYFKLYRTGEYGKYSYGIRVYDINPISHDNKGIVFDIEEANDKLLYRVFSIFAKGLGNDIMRKKHNDKYDDSYITTDFYKGGVAVNFYSVCDSKESLNNFIDIKIDCDRDDRDYKLMEQLFRNMAVLTSNMKNEEVSLKVRRLNRR